ncbi:MAG TPA: hypothetical protein VKY92_02745, partial [Verrucomicrobiae bacterium]|nr:hypothetical protein [Verrucomicrobiae bacterium]
MSDGPIPSWRRFQLDAATPQDPALFKALEQVDRELRARFSMNPSQTAVGILDLQAVRLAWLRPDEMMYAASLSKIGILLAFFQSHPELVANLPATTRHELGLMIKQSSNSTATRFSRELGLREI